MTARYSWPSFKNALRLDIHGVICDGSPLPDGAVDGSERRVKVGGPGWRTLTASLTLDLGGQEFPPELREVRDQVEAVAVLTSEAGYARIPVRLSTSTTEPDRFTGSLSVARAEVAGLGRIEAEVVAEIGGVGHRVVGTADSWAIVFDESDAPPSGGQSPINTVWVDFTSPPPSCGVLASYSDAPIHLDLAGSEPVIYLNSGLKSFHAVLTLEHAKGDRKTVRDLMGSWMATTVTLALARTGLRELTVDPDGTISRPAVPAVDRALDALVKEMQSVETVEQMAERLARAEHEPAVEAALWAEVFLSACRLTNAGPALDEAGERVLYA